MQRSKQPRSGGKNKSAETATSGPEPPPISNRRQWLFRVVAITLVPLFLLGALELALRVAGYGYPTSFFLRTRINGRTVYIENQKFGLRFFPAALARSPSPVVMEAAKTANSYRIFLLGESAALGDPDPAYGCGRYLEVLLGERYPGTRFEVICVAMTAINSHAILPIARECAQRDGDLWVIYAGNNEMVGPFGAGTIFGPRAPGLALIRAALAAKTTRVGQLLDALLGRLTRGSSTPPPWGGMGMFLGHQIRPDDPGRQRVYRYFRNNLEQIVRLGRRAGVKMVLSNVASNLKDCPPFASLHSANLEESQRNAWDPLYRDGHALESLGQFSLAADKYSEAARLDQEHAGLQYELGSCLLALTNLAQARHCYELARDFDALPFRADSRINEIIEKVAREYANQGVYRLDAIGVLSPDDAPRIPGQETFFEHVHLNFDGNYLLARAMAEQVARLLPPAIAKNDKREWPSSELCARRLALTDWNRYRVCETILQRVSQAPFTNQSNSVIRQKTYRENLIRLKSAMNAGALKQARDTFQKALSDAPNDFFLHRKYAELLETAGDPAGALAEWRRVCELLPHHPIAYFQLGRLLARQGKTGEAEEYFARAIRIRPEFVEAIDESGQALAKQGKWEQSIARYVQALGLQPNDATIHLHLADVLAAHGRRAEALANLREAIRLRPGFWEARYLLGVELALQEKIEEARGQFAEVIRLQPDFAPGHLNLGVALAKQGRMEDAFVQFRETLRLDPQNKLARQHIETIQSLKSRTR